MDVVRHGREAVLRLAAEDPQSLPAVHAAVSVAERAGGEFAGTLILSELQRSNAGRTLNPNFRRLVTFGILEKVGGSRRGRQHAYYRILDVAGVRCGLEEAGLGDVGGVHGRLSFTAIGRSGRPDLSTAAETILRSEFPAP